MDAMSSIATIVGLIATFGTISFGVPQAIKVWRDKSAEGVSRITWWLALAICWPWGAYGYSAGDLFLLVTNILAALVAIWVLVVCDRRRWAPVLIATVSASVAGVAILLLSPLPVLIGVATIMLIASRVPQLVLLMRIKTARDVSLTTWLLSLLTGASWTIYGVLRADPVIYTANGIATAMTIAIIWRLIYLQKSSGRGNDGSSAESADSTDLRGQENPNAEKF